MSTTTAYVYVEHADGTWVPIGEWDPVRRQFTMRAEVFGYVTTTAEQNYAFIHPEQP